MASTRAPGDADRLCTEIFPSIVEVPSAPLPANAKVLMDSYDYILLLPRAAGGVWQQVDLDDNNLVARGTEVCTLEHIDLIAGHVIVFSHS